MDHETEAPTNDRLEQVESQIHALMGHIKALEYGLRLLIATHPAPDVILHTLNRVTEKALTPDLVTDNASGPMYQAALEQGLGILREQVTEAVAHRP